MPERDRTITPEDLLSLEEYEKIRPQRLADYRARKKKRQLAIGPNATIFFENWHTMLSQIQEMLRIEKGGAEQLRDELEAYNPMVPNGRELTATLMFEVEDQAERREFLARLGGVENQVFIAVGEERIEAVPEGDVERSTAEGKTSAVHFLHFPFEDDQVVRMGDQDVPVEIGIDHKNYSHRSPVPDEIRNELLADFD